MMPRRLDLTKEELKDEDESSFKDEERLDNNSGGEENHV